MRRFVLYGFTALCASAFVGLTEVANAVAPEATPAPASADARGWVEQMKVSPRGPFEGIRWFCKDGSVLPPRPYACAEHGGGIQHGLLGPQARQLRERGYFVANVLASLDPKRFVGAGADLEGLHQLVLERFLIGWDEGWIFRGAQSYRGAFQIEDEETAAEKLLLTLLAEPAWRQPSRYFLLRELARGLPLQGQRDLAARMRALAAQLGDADPGFAPLRARIHASPQGSDAQRVRAYAQAKRKSSDYEELARTIDEFFRPRASAEALAPLLLEMQAELRAVLRGQLDQLEAPAPGARLVAAARGLVSIRRALPETRSPAAALAALRASIALEREAFASGQAALDAQRQPTRRDLLHVIEPLTAALYGAGLIGERSLFALGDSFLRLSADSVRLDAWRTEIAYLGRATEWSRRWLVFHFGLAMQKLGEIEPLVALYEADRLRGSPLLPYSRALDALAVDAQRLAGVEDRVLGEPVGSGLRALNPGIARGRLRSGVDANAVAALPPDSVALLPETVSELPPVAAILTLGEGSSLSHVQLLARNLGIPNAVVGEAVAARLAEHEGEPLEVAVSPGGVVQIDRIDAAQLAPQGAEPPAELVIRLDVDRLELGRRELIPLGELRASDSGRLCGPKAANLGELRAHFGEAVPDGFAIPFGVFYAVLQQPFEPGGPSAFEWLRSRYAALEKLPDRERAAFSAATLQRMRAWIGAHKPSQEFRRAIETSLARLGPGGVFVRSDTNVEDLAGFTGAGLNLTVPNVVGVERVLEAVLRVWASPFGERAHAWRQAHMERPEWVLPSVLVQRAFSAEKSGVMVTLDVETGDPGLLSVAVGEGVGGAVDGQAAESLRIHRASGRVRFLAPATSPLRAELDPAGGVRRVPASGRETLLQPGEVAALIELASRVRNFPALRTAEGEPLAADVEFAFRDGALALLQIRPFVESRRALESERLRALDAPLLARARQQVQLYGELEGGTR